MEGSKSCMGSPGSPIWRLRFLGHPGPGNVASAKEGPLLQTPRGRTQNSPWNPDPSLSSPRLGDVGQAQPHERQLSDFMWMKAEFWPSNRKVPPTLERCAHLQR